MNQIKKNFLINFKIRVGLQEEMLLARSKEVGDKVLANERQMHKSPRVGILTSHDKAILYVSLRILV